MSDDNTVETSPPKTWKRIGLFNDYASAAAHKTKTASESDQNTLLKIKRCGPDGSKFQVRMWHPDMMSKKNKKRTKSKNKPLTNDSK